MGNTTSSSKGGQTKVDLLKSIDSIAYNLITKQNFQDMKKLESKQYCDKLIILTSKILKKYLNDREIAFLQQRQSQGAIVNQMSSDYMAWISRDTLDKVDYGKGESRTRVHTERTRLCKGIAKFYIKIAHIFAAIVSTVNPYFISPVNNEKETLMGKKGKIKRIPKNTKLKQAGFCDNRIKALEYITDLSKNTMTIRPKPCKVIVAKTRNQSGKCVTTYKTLANQQGIPEFKHLYYDTWNPESNKFSGMSDTAKADYKKDLQQFYKAFTGKDTMPEEITRFSQIKMRDFYCAGDPKNKCGSKQPPTATAVATAQPPMQPPAATQPLKQQPVTAQPPMQPPAATQPLKQQPVTAQPPMRPPAATQPLKQQPVEPPIYQQQPVTAQPPMRLPMQQPVTAQLPMQPQIPQRGGGMFDLLGGPTIKLSPKEYHHASGYTAHKNNIYFREYAKNLGKMIETSKTFQDKLLTQIELLFDTKDNSINPKLNESDLNKIMKNTRDIILQSYITCELDFRNILEKNFSKIVESQSFKTKLNRDKTLKKQQAAILKR